MSAPVPAPQSPNANKTRLLYMEPGGAWLYEGRATVLDVLPCGSLVLDQTLFYPGGGGQPCDVGTIESASGAVFAVSKVTADHSGGAVVHSGAATAGSFAPGDAVALRIDAAARGLATRLHTGGHLVDLCMESLGLSNAPTKGSHYPGASYVAYAGAVAPELRAELPRLLTAEAARIVAEDRPVRVEWLAVEEAERRTGAQLPEFLRGGAPVRFVTIEGQRQGYPCAGTHVDSTGQVGRLVCTKVSKKGHETRVSYHVDTQPSITVNQFAITEGSTIVVTSSMVSACDGHARPWQLRYAVSEDRDGWFSRARYPAIAVRSFTQADINRGLLVFSHAAGSGVPRYVLVVSNDNRTSAPSSSRVRLNHVPVVAVPLEAQASCCSASVGHNYSFVVPEGAFVDSDNDTLAISAELSAGMGRPRWLTFDGCY
eukprot:m51a1_g8990 putative alanine-trna acid forming aminoacyl-trna and related binding isoform 1 (428) ;mRNA; f:80175-82276